MKTVPVRHDSTLCLVHYKLTSKKCSGNVKIACVAHVSWYALRRIKGILDAHDEDYTATHYIFGNY